MRNKAPLLPLLIGVIIIFIIWIGFSVIHKSNSISTPYIPVPPVKSLPDCLVNQSIIVNGVKVCDCQGRVEGNICRDVKG